MYTSRGQDLVGYFRNRVGWNLHSIIEYGESSWEFLYARDDIRAEMSADEVDVLLRYARSKGPSVADAPFREPNVGCSVWCFDRAAVLHLTRTRGQNVIVTLEPEAAPRLHSVVNDCRQILSET